MIDVKQPVNKYKISDLQIYILLHTDFFTMQCTLITMHTNFTLNLLPTVASSLIFHLNI